jgi:hypothetical protein
MIGSYSLLFYTSPTTWCLPGVAATQIDIVSGAACNIQVRWQPGDDSALVAGEAFSSSDAAAASSFADDAAARRMPSGGLALFDRLQISRSGACYSIAFALGSLQPAKSISFSVKPGEEGVLILEPPQLPHDNSQGPVEVDAGETLPPQIQGTGGDSGYGAVLIADKAGNRLYYSKGLVQVSLTLVSNNLQVPVHSSNLGVYQLRFEKVAGNAELAFSGPFRVVIGQPHALRILLQAAGASPGHPLRT